MSPSQNFKSNCHHYFVIDSPQGYWSKANCKKCGLIKALGNSDDNPHITESSRIEFLKNSGVDFNNLCAKDKREWLKPYVQKYGIQQTARLLNKPTSSIGKWAEGLSRFPRNSQKYSKEFRFQAILEYTIKKNFYGVAKQLEIPRSTLQSWVRKYAISGTTTS